MLVFPGPMLSARSVNREESIKNMLKDRVSRKQDLLPGCFHEERMGLLICPYAYKEAYIC